MSTAVSRLAARRSLSSRKQRATVGQVRQVVVERDIRRALFGIDAALELDEHRGDGLKGVDLGRASTRATQGG